MTNKTAFVAAELISDKVFKVKEIGLKWNKITAEGGNKIAASLEENVELKILDLSWNAIGVKPNSIRMKKGAKAVPQIQSGDIGKAWS